MRTVKWSLQLALTVSMIAFHAASAAELSAEQWQNVIAAGGAYQSADGGETVQFHQHDHSELLTIAREITDQELPSGAEVQSSDQRDTGPALILVTAYKHAGTTRVLAVSVATRNGGGALSLAHTLDPRLPNASERVGQGGSALLISAIQGQTIGKQSTNSLPAPESMPVPVRNSGKSGQGVARVVFDLDYFFGVGGLTYPNYAPVVLFEDGTACKCLEAAIDEIDVSRIRQAKPKRVGTWRKSGANYEVRWTGVAKPEILKTSVGPPTELPGPSALQGKYQSIGGGGNSAFGGSVTVAAVEDLTFYGDGSFSQSNYGVGMSPAATAWSKRGNSGTWKLAGSTLTFSYRDGKTMRTTVFYSAKRKSTAEFGRYGVLWIGGEDFKRIE